MAKKVHSVSLKGYLDTSTGTVTDITKDGEYVYDLQEILNEFHDKHVSISIKEEIELEPINTGDMID